jgi:probable phosphoglycerate mutase
VIWIVRHTDTDWSAAHRHTGRTDVPLSAAGRDAASRLRPRLAGIDFAEVICSPLRRARQTAELAGLVCTSESADLEEWDYGDYEGLTTVEIREHRPDWDMWRDGTPGGEDAAAVGARVDAVIAGVAGRSGVDAHGGGGHAGEDGDGSVGVGDREVALVAHGHVLRVLTSRWLGLPPADGALFALEPGGIGRLSYERDRRVLWGWEC